MKTLLQFRAAFVAGLVSAMFLPIAGRGQSDNFNDGNDTANPAWTRYQPLSSFGAGGTWTFPGGNTYRIQAAASPNPGALGPARVASLLPNVYSNFYVAVDVVDWDDTLRQAFGILARLGNIGLGTTTGYVLTYQELDHAVSVAKITSEVGSDLAGSSTPVTFIRGNSYRLVFMGRGQYFEGRVYQLPDTTTPIAITTATDSSYPSGQNGLLVYDNSSAHTSVADATFDNYFASDHDPRQVSDNFNDGNDTSPAPAWVHHDPIQDAGLPGGCYAGGTFTFPAGGYRLFSPLPCVPNAGGPRAYSLREETTWGNFYISVDALNWDDSVRQLFGIAARINNPGLGTTAGYLFTWEEGSAPLPNTTGGDLDVLRVQGEGQIESHQMEHDVAFPQDSALHLTSGNNYRFVFIGNGYDFEARIYQLPDTFQPIKRLLAVDTQAMFAEGTVGVIVADHPSDSPYHACTATFDNFYADTAEPAVSMAVNSGFVQVSWPVLAGLWVLQSTPSLTPPVTWTTITSGITRSGLTNTMTITAPLDSEYFRLAQP